MREKPVGLSIERQTMDHGQQNITTTNRGLL